MIPIMSSLRPDTNVSASSISRVGWYFSINRNIAAGVLFLLNNGEIGEKYNITGEREIDNLEMAQIIADTLGKELKYELIDFHSKRPGHDLRYGLDGSKMFKMGWKMPYPLEESLKQTILWGAREENAYWLEE